MSLQIETTYFTPAEAESISGVSAIQQRDFRRHGYLPSQKGRAKFDGYALAELLFVKSMANSGIGPKVAFPNAKICANMIVHNALTKEGVVSGNVDELTELGLVAPFGMSHDEAEQNLMKLRKTFPDKVDSLPDTPAEFAESLNSQARREFAQRYITSQLGSRVLSGNYFILWGDGSELWTENLTDAFDGEAMQSPKLAKPAIVLSLESVAYNFARSLPKPLFSLNYQPPSAEKGA